jgi:hypothetical protein
MRGHGGLDPASRERSRGLLSSRRLGGERDSEARATPRAGGEACKVYTPQERDLGGTALGSNVPGTP